MINMALEDLSSLSIISFSLDMIIIAACVILGVWLTKWIIGLFIGYNSTMSPENVSSLFPDRPIRPLPKRRLRERLSPEVAESIKYPPATHTTTPLFYYPPYTLREEISSSTGFDFSPSTDRGRDFDGDASPTPQRNGTNVDGEEEDVAVRSALVARSPPEILNRSVRLAPKPDLVKHPSPQPPPSTASSVDGYDSFENTNNKKKRKIPTAGDINLNGSHPQGEIGSLTAAAATSPTGDVHSGMATSTTSQYYGSSNFAASNQGISGPGRGRFGRARNGRSPLRALSDGNNTWAGRSTRMRQPQWASPSSKFFLRESMLFDISFKEDLFFFLFPLNTRSLWEHFTVLSDQPSSLFTFPSLKSSHPCPVISLCSRHIDRSLRAFPP
jgi:hypothetical protein